ncbi:hypothetical protein GQ53DRAFT_726944 [Thozetella sp. PMI_491]|nr:hypothetical protein GQ53DRAFT_726944 [Thozetella sp. PMI_491]
MTFGVIRWRAVAAIGATRPLCGARSRPGVPFARLGLLRQSFGRHSSSSSHENSRPPGSPAESQGRREPPNPDATQSLFSKVVESAATTLTSITVLAFAFGIAGYAYHASYKQMVLQKMANAFEPGDPVLDLAAIGKNLPLSESAAATHWVERPEQKAVDAIVAGLEMGHYYLLLGEKGTGKSSMLLEAIRKIDGYGVAMFEAHADLEVVRIRLGRALDFEFAEDRLTYFSERGLRDTTALLDIERALNKLEKVALQRRATVGRPLVVIINQMHLIRDDEDGKDLFELLQQRAEQWAASHLVTMVFNSDDYWVYERLKQLANRMEVISVLDLPKAQATAALQKYRERYFDQRLSAQMADEVYNRVGGRLSFLNRVAKSENMLETCEQILDVEKKWFLNQCWILGETMDDDVMDQQKFAAAAMVLATALVDKEEEMERIFNPEEGHLLPSFPLHKAQEIMTRSDFIRQLDRMNLFSITSNADVRASSVPMHLAFKEIVELPGFRQHLDATNDRIAAIESLGRTRELVAKDLVLGAKYEIRKTSKGYEVTVVEEENDD